MSNTRKVKVGIGSGKGTVLESDMSDDEVKRIVDDEQAQTEPEVKSGYSKSDMAAFRRAKRKGAVQDARSRRSVEEMRQEREGEVAAPDVPEEPECATGQTNLFDFKEV